MATSERVSDERVREIAEWFDVDYGVEPICNVEGDSHGITEWEVTALAREVQELRQERGPVPDDDPVLPLGALLAELLDDDHWNNVEPMLDALRATLAATEARLAEVQGAMRADEERLNAAAVKVWGENIHGCDAPEWMAEEIIGLRAERDRLAGFASWVLEQHTGTIDGCDIEAKAVELGLMDAVMCDGTCADCEGVPGEDICYRPHRLGPGGSDAS